MPTKGAAKLSSETENYFEIMKQPFGTSTPPPPAPANKKKKKNLGKYIKFSQTVNQLHFT